MSDKLSPWDQPGIRPQKASMAIYEQIRAKILSGELKPGDKLPSERELIDMFQRSRPTVREALRMLENKNYITISRGKGTTVNKLSTEEIERTLASLVRLNLISLENVIEIRNVCENLAISLAASHRTEQDIRVLREILENEQSCCETVDVPQAIHYGFQFNSAIARAAGNEMLGIIIRITSRFSRKQLVEHLEGISPAERKQITDLDMKEHWDMLDAIIAGDPERATELNRQHLKDISRAFFDL